MAAHFRTTWEDVASWNILYYKHKVDYINYLDRMDKMKQNY